MKFFYYCNQAMQCGVGIKDANMARDFDGYIYKLTSLLKCAALEAKANILYMSGEPYQDLLELAYKCSPNQPRIPAGNSDGGQWTSGGGGGSPSRATTDAIRQGTDNHKPFERVGTFASNTPLRSNTIMAGDLPKPKAFETSKANEYLHNNLSENHWGDGNCAKNVANAIRAADISLEPPLPPPGMKYPAAKDYGHSLENAHFSKISENDYSGKYPPNNYSPQRGDVVVIQPIPGQSRYGHMALYDGKQWVSDFKQERHIWPNRQYEQHGANYKIYRHSNLE